MKRTAKGSNICNKLIFIGSQVLIIYSNISRTPPQILIEQRGVRPKNLYLNKPLKMLLKGGCFEPSFENCCSKPYQLSLSLTHQESEGCDFNHRFLSYNNRIR